MNNRKLLSRIVSVILVIILTAAVTGCGQKDTAVKMTYLSASLNVPSFVERDQGILTEAYAEKETGFEYVDLANGSGQIDLLASGEAQILSVAGFSSIIMASAAGADVRIVNMYSRAPKTYCMFSEDASIVSPRDLIGKSIAGPKGTLLHELLLAYLETDGVKIEEVDFVDMDIPTAVASLEGGSVDVALVGGIAAYKLEKKGLHKICDGEGLLFAATVSVVSGRFASENPGLVDVYVESQKKTVDYMRSHEEETIGITAETLEMEEDDIRAMYPLYDYSVDISDEDLNDMQIEADRLYYYGFISREVNVKDIIYTPAF